MTDCLNMNAINPTVGPSENRTYKGFISYSHAADDRLAPALQSGLQRFAKPWYDCGPCAFYRRQDAAIRDTGVVGIDPEGAGGCGLLYPAGFAPGRQSKWVEQDSRLVASKPAGQSPADCLGLTVS